jgi:hypothetical protein
MKLTNKLSSFRWYRKSVGGTWYCYLSKIGWNGFYRKWTQEKPKDRQKLFIKTKKPKDKVIVEMEAYGNINYQWTIPKNIPIYITTGYLKIDKVYYNNTKGLLYPKVFLFKKEITPVIEED